MGPEATTDLTGWLAELAARLQVPGHLVCPRALASPADHPPASSRRALP